MFKGCGVKELKREGRGKKSVKGALLGAVRQTES